MTSYTLKIGKTSYPASSLADVSAQFAAQRNKAMADGLRRRDDFPIAYVYEGGRHIGFVSWNGCVWSGEQQQPGEKLFPS